MNNTNRPQVITFTELRRTPNRRAVVWPFVLLILAQSFMPIQSHSRLVQTHDGHVIEMCTLNGVVLVDADTGRPVADKPAARSPAMVFSDLMTTALSGASETQLAWTALIALERHEPAQGAIHNAPAHSQRIRAPPFSA